MKTTSEPISQQLAEKRQRRLRERWRNGYQIRDPRTGETRTIRPRRDGWVEPEDRLAVAERLTKAAIRRIEFPKRGEPFFLSLADRDDALAAGMMACVEAGFFEHGRVSHTLHRTIRNAIRGRHCLRQQCQREQLADDLETVAAAVGFVTEDELVTRRLSAAQRDAARQVLADLRRARDLDTSRKRESNFRSHRGFFLEVLAHLTGRSGRIRTPNAACQRSRRFADYIGTAWRDARANPISAGVPGEILRALESRAFA